MHPINIPTKFQQSARILTHPAVRIESTNPDQMSPTNRMSMKTIEDELIPMWNRVAIPRELKTNPQTPTVGMTTAFVTTRAERQALLIVAESSPLVNESEISVALSWISPSWPDILMMRTKRDI